MAGVRRVAIPSTFELAGRDWTVELVSASVINKLGGQQGILGLCIQHEAKILLRKSLKRQEMEHVFTHELSHAIAGTLGWEDLNNDEGKIDALGGMVHQYLKTQGEPI